MSAHLPLTCCCPQQQPQPTFALKEPCSQRTTESKTGRLRQHRTAICQPSTCVPHTACTARYKYTHASISHQAIIRKTRRLKRSETEPSTASLQCNPSHMYSASEILTAPPGTTHVPHLCTHIHRVYTAPLRQPFTASTPSLPPQRPGITSALNTTSCQLLPQICELNGNR